MLEPCADGVGYDFGAPNHCACFDVSHLAGAVDDVGRRQVAYAFVDEGGL